MTVLLLLALVARPNLTETPGLVRPLSRVAVCSTTWGLDRRHVTESMKKHVAAAYGVRWADRRSVEFDHLVPRELGGADDVRNLWPQPLAEAKLKDRQENALHRAVCAGTVTLTAAQAQMRAWGRRMKNFFRKIWGREAIVATVVSGVSVWEAIPPVLAAFGHPLTGEQIRTLGMLLGAIGVVVARFQVVSKDTHTEAVQNALRQSV